MTLPEGTRLGRYEIRSLIRKLRPSADGAASLMIWNSGAVEPWDLGEV